MKKHICILSATGGEYGTGHVSRMMWLARYLSLRDYRVSFVCGAAAKGLFTDIPFYAPEIPAGVDVIIRDMRDSLPDEIAELKKIATVVAVDDCGSGRVSADVAVDCLPNLLYDNSLKRREESVFLYGDSFVRYISSAVDGGRKSTPKDIDFCIYIGRLPNKDAIGRIMSILPEKSTVCTAGSDELKLYSSLHGTAEPQDFPEALLRSRCIITHFGVTLFEADICGCRCVTLNPSQYHEDLCKRAASVLDIVNLGMINTFDTQKAKNDLNGILLSANKVADAEMALHHIDNSAGRFFELISALL